MSNRDIYEPIAREAAKRYGLDEDTYVRQITQESGWNPTASNPSGAYGIAQIIKRFHPEVDPADPIASLDYAAKWMSQLLANNGGSYARALASFNWGPGNVATWDGLRGSLPAETRHYLDVILGPGWPEPTREAAMPDHTLRVTDAGVRLRSGPGTDSAVLATLPADTLVAPLSDHAWREVQAAGQRGWIAADLLADVPTDDSGSAETPQPAQNRKFDPTIPTELQRQDWTCSIRSVMWMLKSIGIAVTPDEAQDAMSPRYVTSDVGLRDASGAGIVEVLRDHWGVEAVNFGHISFDEAMSLAGTGPLAIGLRNWGGPGHGHWSAVRGRGDGTLVLANPAGTGPIYGQQTLDRQQFDARGPASAVWVNVNGT